ncbi:MAG: hypothetical protein AAGC99_08975 [Pseudomonadota bacterium]
MTPIALCLSAGADAHTGSIVDRLYAELQAGGGWPYGNDVEGTGLQSDVDFDPGLVGGGAVGIDIDDNWRAELEYMYRSNDVDDFGGSEIDADSDDFASVALWQMPNTDPAHRIRHLGLISVPVSALSRKLISMRKVGTMPANSAIEATLSFSSWPAPTTA